MATCKDCFHYDACKGILDAVGIEMDAECQNQETLCGNFMSCNITKNIMTNADRIRAMTDEELEQFINNFIICDIRTNDECKMSYCACCEVCVMDWLKQPSE